MKKTITINISGIIFHIEEDAYEKLTKYLQTIRGYFKDSEGRDEIMSDIESRIAEMLQPKVSNAKQAVVMNDVDEVISIMGQPEVFAENADSSGEANQEPVYESTKNRRIFRDPDSKVLGGVCSGIAARYGLDPVWLRLIFGLTFILGFGTGLLIYILLWIIIPKAQTAADKLEMRGESVNVNNIGKVVTEEAEQLKKKMSDLASEAKELGNKQNRERYRGNMENVLSQIGRVVLEILVVVGKVIGGILALVACLLLIGLFVAIFTETDVVTIAGGNLITMSLHELTQLVFESSKLVEATTIGLILMVAAPLLSIAYWGIRKMFGIKTKRNPVKYIALGAFLTGVVLFTIAGNKLFKEFSDEVDTKEYIHIQQPKGGILFLNIKSSDLFDHDDAVKKHGHHVLFDNLAMDDNNMYISYPELDIVPSETDSFELLVIKSAHGIDRKDAIERASATQYQVNQKDSLLAFDTYFTIAKATKWRGQDVKLRLKVPRNKMVFLSNGMSKIIYDIDNVRNIYDGDMVGRMWKMTPEGLDCVDCAGLEGMFRHRHSSKIHINKDGIKIENDPEIPEPPVVPEMEKEETKA